LRVDWKIAAVEGIHTNTREATWERVVEHDYVVGSIRVGGTGCQRTNGSRGCNEELAGLPRVVSTFRLDWPSIGPLESAVGVVVEEVDREREVRTEVTTFPSQVKRD
jgi:hypothetical protein